MKKIAMAAASVLMASATIGMPVMAQAAPYGAEQIKVIAVNSNQGSTQQNTQQVKEQLSQYGINLDEIIKNNCITLPNNCTSNQSNCPANQSNCPTGNNGGDSNGPAPGNPVTPVPPVTPAPPAAPAAPGTPEVPQNPAAPGEEDTALTIQEQIVELVNEERTKAGLSPVTGDTTIQSAAQVRAAESAVSFSHTRPNGQNFSTALTEAGVTYKGSGENLAWGQKTPEEVMKGWMNSPGHKANLLNPDFTKIGVGYYQNANGVNYWSQLFTY